MARSSASGDAGSYFCAPVTVVTSKGRHKRTTMKPAKLLLPLLLLSLMSRSQDHAELANVTVTSSLLEQQQRETGRNILTVKGEYFYQLPVHSVDELLRYLPGVEVQQRGPQGSQSNILIRGGTFQQVLIIMDGIRLNDPLTGHFNSYIPLNPSEIERIEILKGSASALYGSEAVGGVIYIISKTFHRKNAAGKNQLNGQVTGGQFNLINADAHGRLASRKSILSGGFQSRNADGPALKGTDGFFHLMSATAALSVQPGKNWTLSFRSGADFRSFNARHYYTVFSSDTAREKVGTWWNQLQLRKPFRKGELTADAGFKKLRDRYWFRPAAVPNDNRTSLFSAQVYYHSVKEKRTGYAAGIQLSRKAIFSNDRGNHQLWHGAVYGIFRQQLGKSFHLTQSLRLDWDGNYGLILVPQVHLAWSKANWGFRAAGGRSFRDADFTERYNNYNKTLVTSGSIGNPWLKAEDAWNAEAGADFTPIRGMKISSSFFFRHFRNLIDWTPTAYADMPRKDNLSPAGQYSLARNIETVRSLGTELDIRYQYYFNEKVSLYALLGYTWIRSRNDDPVPSFYISSHARHLLNSAVILQTGRFSIAVSSLFKERNPRRAEAIGAVLSPSYFILGTKIGYRFLKRKANVYVQADNLTDTRYSDLLGAEMPGRWLSAGFQIALWP